jgi:HAD superfamily hydrolase (TIGR01490 family)
MSLAIFDLDNTLLAGDSDHLWGEFLVEQQVVCKETYGEANKRFYRQYQEGGLDIDEFLQFSLRPLAEHDPAQLFAWRDLFVEQKIRPILLQAARELIARHRQAGDRLMVITATNRFVTEPIVGLYGIEHLIATTPEFVDGRFTGRYVDIPSFQEGKVKLLEQWLSEQQESLEGSWFYSDSHNDLPLLRRVANPVVVDPDAKLRQVAQAEGWPVISLR